MGQARMQWVVMSVALRISLSALILSQVLL